VVANTMKKQDVDGDEDEDEDGLPSVNKEELP
jgi:hypothetical protein